MVFSSQTTQTCTGTNLRFPYNDMDLPHIGAHCTLRACNLLDFLPIKCRCNKFYCAAHINPDHHACLANPIIALNPNFNTAKLNVCGLGGCEKARLSKEETCSACHGSFCVKCITPSYLNEIIFSIPSFNSHRHPETHSCSILSLHQKEPKKTPPVDSLLSSKKTFQARYKKLPADPFKFEQHQKMEFLKMRQRAFPGDPKYKSAFVPPDQRLHIRISIDDVERVFWFQKVGLLPLIQ